MINPELLDSSRKKSIKYEQVSRRTSQSGLCSRQVRYSDSREEPHQKLINLIHVFL